MQSFREKNYNENIFNIADGRAGDVCLQYEALWKRNEVFKKNSSYSLFGEKYLRIQFRKGCCTLLPPKAAAFSMTFQNEAVTKALDTFQIDYRLVYFSRGEKLDFSTGFVSLKIVV